MEETREQQKLHGFLQCLIYLSIALETAIFVYLKAPFWGFFVNALARISHVAIYHSLIYSKLFTFLLICLVSVGTLSKKKQNLDPKKHIAYPLGLGLVLFFGSIIYCNRASPLAFEYTSWLNLLYMICSLIGAVMTSVAMDNVSKIIRVLELRFGQKEHIINYLLNKLQDIPSIKDNDLTSLIAFGRHVRNLVQTLKSSIHIC